MILLLFVSQADATSVSVATSSAQFEAVVRVKRGAAGTPVGTTLLLDDYATSAPIADATASLALQGPASVEVALARGAPGTYTGTATFPSDGDYAGALVVTTPAASDLMSVSGLHLGDDPGPAVADSAITLLGRLGGVVAIGLGGLIAVGVGYAIGRRRGATVAVGLLAAAVTANQVSAHGGEDHGAPTPVSGTVSGGLHLPMESQFLVELRTARLVHASFQEQVPALGRFVARAGGSATLRSPVAGEFVAPAGGFPAPGSSVGAGQVLGVVRERVGGADRSALASARQQAATAVAEAKKAVVLAERDATQSTNLGGGISERERLEREQSATVARTALAEAQRALVSIGDGASVVIRAPVAGKLGSARVRPGDEVQAGDELFRVVDAAGLWMEARVPERYAAGLVSGSTASVVSPAFPGLPLPAILLDAGQEADPSTGTLTVTLSVEALGHDLHPGMSATAWLGRGAVRDTLVVPDAAVVDSNGMSLGFVKVGPEQFELRELKLGGRSGQSWEVLSGLNVGERVVTDGTYTLRSLAGR